MRLAEIWEEHSGKGRGKEGEAAWGGQALVCVWNNEEAEERNGR